MAPRAKSEALVSTLKGLVGLEWINTGADIKACLSASKARCVAAVHTNGTSFLISEMRVYTIVENLSINRRYKLAKPRNDCTSFSRVEMDQS
jgi:hypothetical protein